MTDIELDIVSNQNAVIGISSRPCHMATGHLNQCEAHCLQHKVEATVFWTNISETMFESHMSCRFHRAEAEGGQPSPLAPRVGERQ